MPPRWCSADSMPYWAHRIRLVIVSVDLQSLSDLKLGDIGNEGISEPYSFSTYREFWDKQYGRRGYPWFIDEPPYVWVIRFRMMTCFGGI